MPVISIHRVARLPPGGIWCSVRRIDLHHRSNDSGVGLAGEFQVRLPQLRKLLGGLLRVRRPRPIAGRTRERVRLGGTTIDRVLPVRRVEQLIPQAVLAVPRLAEHSAGDTPRSEPRSVGPSQPVPLKDVSSWNRRASRMSMRGSVPGDAGRLQAAAGSPEQ